MLVAGVDVGGTNVEGGLVDDDHAVSATSKSPTADSVDGVVDAVVSLVEELPERPLAVGVGIPGVVSKGRVLAVPNLEGWSDDTDVVGMLSERLGVPVAVGNDAQVGLLGEWVAGVAKGARDVLGVWWGTGIGAGLVLDGRPFEGATGGAGELGHVQVRPGGALCGCGRRGCVEAYAGRRMMTEAARRMVEAGRESSLFEIMDEKDKPRPTSSVWEEALDDGDELALELFDVAVEALGAAVGSAMNLLDVELVVLGGGLPEKMGADLAERVAEHARPVVLHDPEGLRIEVSELGDDAGVVGAAWLARGVLATGTPSERP